MSINLKIKKLLSSILTIVALCLFCGCTSDKTISQSRLEITPMALSFSEKYESKSIKILSSGSWSTVVPKGWCTLSQTSGNGNAEINVSVIPNTSGDSRSQNVVVTVGEISLEIAIMQSANAEAYTQEDLIAQKSVGFYLRKNKAETFVYNADMHQMAVNSKAETYRIQTYNQDTTAAVSMSMLPDELGDRVTLEINYIISNQKDTTMYFDTKVVKIDDNKAWLYDSKYGAGVVVDVPLEQ